MPPVFTRTTQLLVSMLGLLLLNACSFEGELGVAEFSLSGGVETVVWGDWSPDSPIANHSVLSVRARADEDLPSIDLRSGNEDILTPFLDAEEPAGGATGFFQATGTGRVAIELFSLEDGELIDFFSIDIEEAAGAVLLRHEAVGRQVPAAAAPEAFGVVEQVPVTFEVQLSDSTDHTLNHHHVVTGSSSDEDSVDVNAGGTVVVIEGIAGSAEVTVGATGQPATAIHQVSVVLDEDVTAITVQETGSCDEESLALRADLTTAEGLPVLGAPISWQVEGTDSFDEKEDLLLADYDDSEFSPLTVTAHFGDLSASFDLSEPAICEAGDGMGCSLAPRSGPGESAALALLLLALIPALRRRG